ncbi:MAG: hypothetical protein IJ421_09220 [Prevotella sp.]|nr:hypothetical protein [Prevotella sp.]
MQTPKKIGISLDVYGSRTLSSYAFAASGRDKEEAREHGKRTVSKTGGPERRQNQNTTQAKWQKKERVCVSEKKK